MKNARHLLGSIGVCWVTLVGCNGDALLGENGDACYGKQTVCTSDAPSYSLQSAWIQPSEGVVTGRFEVTPSTMLKPTWRHEWPCESGSCRGIDIASAGEGDVWLTQVQPELGQLRRIDSDGKLVSSYEWTPPQTLAPFQLAVGAEGDPVLIHQPWSGSSGQVLRLQGPNLSSVTLPLEGLTELAFPGAGDRLMFLRYQASDRLIAEAYAPSQGLVWRQTDLRADGVDMNTLNNLTLGRAATPLRDGGFAFWTGKAAQPGESANAGISVIDADGNVRWDARLTELGGGYRLAEAKAGSLVAAFANGADDLKIALISARGELQASWVGRRQDYFPVFPSLLAVDPAGDVYVGLITGDRTQPALTVCRLSPEVPQRAVFCAAIGPAFRDGLGALIDDAGVTASGATELATLSRFLGMEAPEPGVLVFLTLEPTDMDTTESEPSTVASLLRVDFPSMH